MLSILFYVKIKISHDMPIEAVSGSQVGYIFFFMSLNKDCV